MIGNVLIMRLYLTLTFCCFYAALQAQSDSLKLLSFELSNCLGGSCKLDYMFKISTEIVRNDTIYLQLDGYANCGGIHDMTARQNGDTVHFYFKQGGLELVSLNVLSTYEIQENGDTLIIEDTSRFTPMSLEINAVMCDCPYLFNFIIPGVKPMTRYKYTVNGDRVYLADDIEVTDNPLRKALIVPELDSLVNQIWKHSEILRFRASFGENTLERKLHIIVSGKSDDNNYYWVDIIEEFYDTYTELYSFRIVVDQNYLIQYANYETDRYINIDEWTKQLESNE